MSFIILKSGQRFYPLSPRPEDINIYDLAYALAHTNRFSGHAGEYSVAQHSVYVSEQCPNFPLQGLLHDAHEVLGMHDWASPVKHLMPDVVREWFDKACASIDYAVFAKFGCVGIVRSEQEVCLADLRMLKTECVQLMPPEPCWDNIEVEPYNFTIERWPAAEAEMRFIERFVRIKR